MAGFTSVINQCGQVVRAVMRIVARGLNRLSHGRLHPNVVTLVGLIAHIPIAFLIIQEQFAAAAGLLVFFGLFDTLDGELARLQGQTSRLGMLLDSASDRMKEAILYMGVAYLLVTSAQADGKDVGWFAALAVGALGGSLLVSYINAWGEVVMAGRPISGHQTNRSLRIGVMKFEVRMALLVLGLLFDWLVITVLVIAVFSWLTALVRLSNVSRQLNG